MGPETLVVEQPELTPKDLVAAIAEMAGVKPSRVELYYSWVDGEFLAGAVVHLPETGRGKNKVSKRLSPRGLTSRELLEDLAKDLASMKGTP